MQGAHSPGLGDGDLRVQLWVPEPTAVDRLGTPRGSRRREFSSRTTGDGWLRSLDRNRNAFNES